ncbi:DUF523 domain-containing protein [candidate division KSB1 bacterium]|nr:DUF523 domain-containing protein [candidate division KSB1 bacterium]
MNKPKLGISTCLLGENVRYDGGHKLDRYLRDTLGLFVEWVSICPEVDCGLSIPREPMQLEGNPDAPHLITCETRIDHTDQMMQWAEKRLDVLKNEILSGFVFKARSPSCGIRDIPIYNLQGKSVGSQSGIFTGMFMRRFPLIPIEDEEGMKDPDRRQKFLKSVSELWRGHPYNAKGIDFVKGLLW